MHLLPVIAAITAFIASIASLVIGEIADVPVLYLASLCLFAAGCAMIHLYRHRVTARFWYFTGAWTVLALATAIAVDRAPLWPCAVVAAVLLALNLGIVRGRVWAFSAARGLFTTAFVAAVCAGIAATYGHYANGEFTHTPFREDLHYLVSTTIIMAFNTGMAITAWRRFDPRVASKNANSPRQLAKDLSR